MHLEVGDTSHFLPDTDEVVYLHSVVDDPDDVNCDYCHGFLDEEDEHVFLVAVSVTTPDTVSRKDAELWLHSALNRDEFRNLNDPRKRIHVDSWWIAEDERNDGSDNDSAVFVPKTMSQRAARRLLIKGGDEE